MKKDIEWLKEKVEEMYTHYSISNNFDFVSKREAITEISNLIDQLDEPEVLSQKWIDEHKWDNDHIWQPFVCVEDLQTLLVPKQELPVIPKFVADYLDFAKSDTTLMRVLELANTRNEWEKWEKEYDWISANDETFARAWLDGYEVEEEKKYYILTRNNKFLLTKDDGVVRGTYQAYSWVRERDREHYQLTEKEIKDYDERFWAFRKPVEELEK